MVNYAITMRKCSNCKTLKSAYRTVYFYESIIKLLKSNYEPGTVHYVFENVFKVMKDSTLSMNIHVHAIVHSIDTRPPIFKKKGFSFKTIECDLNWIDYMVKDPYDRNQILQLAKLFLK